MDDGVDVHIRENFTEGFDYVDKNWKGDHEEKEVNPSDLKIDGRRKNFREKISRKKTR